MCFKVMMGRSAGGEAQQGELRPVSNAPATAKVAYGGEPMALVAVSEQGASQPRSGGRATAVAVAAAESWEPDASAAEVYTSHGDVSRRRFDSEYSTRVRLGGGF